jgi:diacylglycerol O-acyltransferase
MDDKQELEMARKLSLQDASFLQGETPKGPMHVAGLQLYALPENAPADYMEQLYRRLVDVAKVAAPFNHKLHARFPGGIGLEWVEAGDIDLEYHVRRTALPRLGRIRELLALVSHLHSERLRRDRPLWECYLIEGIEGNRFALYIKMHHSMIDGVAGARLLASRMARQADELAPPPWSAEWQYLRPRVPRQPVPKLTVLESLRSFGGGAGQLAEMLRLPKQGNATTIYRAPRTLFNKPIGGARRFAAQSWSLTRIRAAGALHGATVNDIFLAMCAGALRKYLTAHAALPEIPLVAMVPVALRTADEAEEAGNAVTAVQVSLATHLSDPLMRLQAIQESMSAAKTRLSGMKKAEIDAFTILSSLPFAITQATRLSGRTPPMFNVVISNIPGPRDTLYFDGAKLLANYPVSIVMSGYALNITVQSYRDNLDVGVIACREAVPRVQRMLDYLEKSLVELEVKHECSIPLRAAKEDLALPA